MKKQDFNNIPQTGFKSIDEQSSHKKVIVSLIDRATIVLSAFSVTQLMLGAKLFLDNCKDTMIDKGIVYVPKSIVSLFTTLATAILHGTQLEYTFSFTRDEMLSLRDFLRERMTHCEYERDNRTTHDNGELIFNADAYIGQKTLLLEMNLWLNGEIVEILDETPYALADEEPQADLATIADAEDDWRSQV